MSCMYNTCIHTANVPGILHSAFSILCSVSSVFFFLGRDPYGSTGVHAAGPRDTYFAYCTGTGIVVAMILGSVRFGSCVRAARIIPVTTCIRVQSMNSVESGWSVSGKVLYALEVKRHSR